MDLSNRDLQFFLILAEEKSFTRAASRCHLSQSAFSSRIVQIERMVGAKLFERTTRFVELTPEGLIFYESAQRLHNDFNEVLSDFRDYASRRRGNVCIATIPSVAASWLPAALARFRERHSGINLSLIDTLSSECLQLVRAGKADFAIAVSMPDSEDLDIIRVATDEFYLVSRMDHPLAFKAELNLEDIARYPFVHLSRGSSIRQHLDIALHPTKMQGKLEVRYLATLAGLVEAGIGISLIPAMTLPKFNHPSLMARPFSMPGLGRTIIIARRHGRVLSLAAKALFDQVVSELGKPHLNQIIRQEAQTAG